MVDYTSKYGLVMNEKYIVFALVPIVIITIIIYFKKHIKKKSMMTYGFRFLFTISDKGMIEGDDKEIEFTLPNGHIATMKCIDADKFSDSTKFDIRSGSYETEEQALEYATKLKDAVLYFGVKSGLGLDVGKDKASGGISKYFQNKIFKKKGVKTYYEVHGITTYTEDHPTVFMSMSARALVNAIEPKIFTIEVCNILSTSTQVGSKTKLAMELLLSSYFESSPRAKFLTLVLAAESILSPEDRSLAVKNLIDEFKEKMEVTNISKKEKDSIRGSLDYLYRESISQSLRKMANIYLPHKVYDGMTAENFIKKCYNARSMLVHTGSLDDSKYNIGSLVSSLTEYMTDMLTNISDI